MDLSLFLTFNKIKLLTSNLEDLAKAVSQSEMLLLSKDGTQVCRKTPIYKKEDEDDCTIYVVRQQTFLVETNRSDLLIDPSGLQGLMLLLHYVL